MKEALHKAISLFVPLLAISLFAPHVFAKELFSSLPSNDSTNKYINLHSYNESHVRHRVVELNWEYIEENILQEKNSPFAINLFSDLTIEATSSNLEKDESGHYSWSGDVKATKYGIGYLSFKANLITGNFYIDDRSFQIEPYEGSSYIIIEFDNKKFPLRSGRDYVEFVSAAPQLKEDPINNEMKSESSNPNPYDLKILILISKKDPEKKCHGKEREWEALGLRMEDRLKLALKRPKPTNITPSIEVICAIDHPINKKVETELNWLQDSKWVELKRREHNADLVASFVDCGVFDGTRGTADYSYHINETTYDVAHGANCFESIWNKTSFVHEIGHNLGLNHNREEVVKEGEEEFKNRCNYGYNFKSGLWLYSSIMAYPPITYTKVLSFSNPKRIDYLKRPTPVPLGVACRVRKFGHGGSADNWSNIIRNIRFVSQYHTKLDEITSN